MLENQRGQGVKEWALLANDYYNAGLDEISAQRWGREILRDCPNTTGQDISDALRQHRGVELKRKIAVGDIIRWLRESNPTNAKELKSCSYCNKGWLEVAPDLDSHAFDAEAWALAYKCNVPCTCPAGRYIWENHAARLSGGKRTTFAGLPDIVRSRMDALKLRGQGQQKHRQRLLSELTTGEHDEN